MTSRPRKLSTLSSQLLAERFADRAIAQRIATDDSKPKLGNKHFDEMIRLYVELKSRGAEAQRALLPLLDHSDPDVRLNVATLALEFAPSLAEPVLRSLLPLHGFLASQARRALERWEKGELKFPPYERQTDSDEPNYGRGTDG